MHSKNVGRIHFHEKVTYGQCFKTSLYNKVNSFFTKKATTRHQDGNKGKIDYRNSINNMSFCNYKDKKIDGFPVRTKLKPLV